MKRKRMLAVLAMAASLVASTLAGCGNGTGSQEGTGNGSESGSDAVSGSNETDDAGDQEVENEGGNGSGEEVTITFGVFETDNITSEIWAGMIDSFEADHPGIKIEKMMATGDDRTAFWRTMLNSGEFPDIVIEASNLASMDIFAEVPEDVQALFNEDMLVKRQGKVVDFPATVQYKGQCYYNKAIFEELNLEEPKTWDEFLNVCQTIKDAGKVPLMCGGTGDIWATGAMYWITQGDTQVQAAYPDFVQGLAEGKYKWNNEITQKVLKQYQEMVEKGYYYEGGLSLSYSQCSNAFLEGDAAMLIDGSWMNATLDDAGNEDFGVFAVPAMDGSKIAIGGTGTWGVYKDSKNQEAAWEFVKYIFGENTEPYKNFLAADGLFSTTKTPVTYEMGPVTTKYLENIEGYEMKPEINQTAGDYIVPSGMQSFIDKSHQNTFSGADISAELDSWDVEYQRLMEAQ